MTIAQRSSCIIMTSSARAGDKLTDVVWSQVLCPLLYLQLDDRKGPRVSEQYANDQAPWETR